jgi:hypothetical protein
VAPDRREPHSSPHTGLNATHAAHSPAHRRWWARRAGRLSCRRVLGARPSAVVRTSFIASRWAVISRATRPSAGVSIRGERHPWAAGRLVPGAGVLVAGDAALRVRLLLVGRWGTAAAAAGAPLGRGSLGGRRSGPSRRLVTPVRLGGRDRPATAQRTGTSLGNERHRPIGWVASVGSSVGPSA